MAAPLLQLSFPADNATGVSITANLGLGFDQAVKAGSGFIRIYKADGTLFHTIAITDTSQVTFPTTQPAKVLINPNVDLVAGTGYYILVDAGAIENTGGEDYAGISSSTTLNFTTSGSPPGDTVAPLLNTTTPADNATGVAVGSNLVLTFNEAVKAGTGNIEIRKVSDGTIAKTIAITDTTQATFSGSQLTINPTTDLAAGTGYYVTFASGVVRDLANNNFAGISSSTAFNFTTGSAPGDTTAPTLQSTTPADNATNVLAAANIVLNFDEAVKAGSGNVEIRKVSDDSVVKSIGITDATQVTISGSQVTINPTTNLDWETAYYVKLNSGVVLDVANNAFAGISSPTAFNFTTRDITGPVLVDTTPDPDQVEVDVGSNIVLTFNETVKAGSGTIYINDGSGGSDTRSISVTDTSQVTFSGNVLTINPTSDLALGTGYYVTMASGVVQDLSNNNFAGISGWWDLPFKTTDTIAPLLVETSPADNATDVDRTANLTMTFNESVEAGSGNIEIRRTSDNSVVTSIAVTDTSQVQFSGNWLFINPTNDLAPGAGYYVLMASGVVRDQADNDFAGISSPTTFNFSIPVDTVSPLLVSTSPIDGSADVPIGTNIVLTFDEAVKAGSGNIELRNTADGTIARTIAVTDATQVSFSGYQLTINPSSNLTDGANYYVTMGSGVVLDVSNNPFAGLSGPSAFNFSIAPHLVIGTRNSDALSGDANRNDLIDGRAGLDTLTGQTGDDTYLIKNYEGGQTSILLYTADGSYVYSYLPTEDELNIGAADTDHNGGADTVQLDYDGQTSWWLWFSTARLGTNLLPGTYPNAQPQPYPDPGFPALAISGGFFGFYYYDTGSFTVHEAAFDYSDPDEPVLVSLSISFERYSYNGGPTLYGRVNYNYAAAGAATIDTIVEAPGGGTDTVVASVSVTLPANVENLTLLNTGHQNDWDNENLNGTGNGLANAIVGNAGHNILDGAGNADQMIGGDGDDTYVVDHVGDTIVENPNEGTDSVNSSVTHTLGLSVENLTLTGSANVNGGGNDLANILIGNAGTNVLSGGDGDDAYTLNSVADSVVEASNKGNDTVFVSFTDTLDANVENLTLTGSGNINGTGNTLNNILIGSQLFPGGGGQNVLTGGIGNDTLNGRTGVDTLIGGVGDDTYIIGNYEGGESSLLLQSEPGDYIGDGQTLSFLGNLTVISLYDQTGDGVVDSVSLRYADPEFDHWWYLLFQTGGIGENLEPGTYSDTMDGYPGHPTLDVSGDGRGDEVVGAFTVHQVVFDYSGPEPVLISLSISFEQHIRTLDAPALFGRINYNYAPAGPAIYDTIVENAGEGNDTVEAAVSYTLTANIENLVLGAGADDINGTGNALNNTLTGNDGDNILDGGVGVDAMEGNEGDDTYILDNVGDTVFEEYWWGGNDTVVSPFTYMLGSYVENLTLSGSTNINGTGNELNNILTGNAGANVLTGGLGYDTYYVDPSDTIIEGAGSDADTVYAGFSYTLGANLENLWLMGTGNINATGNAAENLLVGNSGDNILDGGLSNDLLQGNEGNDTYRIQAGAGNDTIYGFTAGVGVGDVVVLEGFTFANFNAILAAMAPSYGGHTLLSLPNGQGLLFYGVDKTSFAADDFGFSAPSAPQPFTLPVSGAYTNTITGTRRADNLTGTAGNNRLDGKQGNDTMTGLAGDDTYVVDTSGDSVVDSSGIDTVISSASSTVLANNVENLTLTGTSNHTATGNGLNNLIVASGRPDTINGGAGNDIIQAGTGACMLTGGTGNDIFAFPVAGSLKTVTDFQVGEDLVDFRSLLTWYGGSNPVGDGVISVTATAGGVLLSVKATAGGALQSLVKLTGISVGDVDVGGDILWDA